MRAIKLLFVGLMLFGSASSAAARERCCPRAVPRSVLAVPADSSAMAGSAEAAPQTAPQNVPFAWGYFGAKVRPYKLYHTGYYGHWYECSTWRIR